MFLHNTYVLDRWFSISCISPLHPFTNLNVCSPTKATQDKFPKSNLFCGLGANAFAERLESSEDVDETEWPGWPGGVSLSLFRCANVTSLLVFMWILLMDKMLRADGEFSNEMSCVFDSSPSCRMFPMGPQPWIFGAPTLDFWGPNLGFLGPQPWIFGAPNLGFLGPQPWIFGAPTLDFLANKNPCHFFLFGRSQKSRKKVSSANIHIKYLPPENYQKNVP